MMIESKGNDLFTSYSSDDAKLKSWLELDTKEKIDHYAEDTANLIKGDKSLTQAAANIYSELFRQYFSKFCPVVQRMSKQYDCIRVFYNKMDEYLPLPGEERLKREREDEKYKRDWNRTKI
jgi:hypothetical protein